MNVLLIQPPASARFFEKVFLFEPLALEYLGAGLRMDRHSVTLLDARLDNDIETEFRKVRPDVVGLTSYTNQVNIVKKMAARLKLLNPDVFIIVGGHHATVSPFDFNEPSIDVVVIGEGVMTLREVMRSLEIGSSLHEIKGLAIPGETMLFSGKRDYTDLDALPVPDRSLTARYRKHYFSEWLKPLASVRTSLGCTGRCSFCALWSITGGKYLRRNPEAVVEELKTINERNVFFCDDESMCDAARMDRLADLIRKAGIKKHYFLYARVDTITEHPELFAKWRKIGLKQVFVGMESFSDKYLEEMKKKITVAQQKKAVSILARCGILMYASFIVMPSFSREDFRALTEYVRELRLQYASFSILTPLPGTVLYARTKNELTSEKPELFDFIHAVLPTTLPLEEFYAEFANLYQHAIPFKYGYKTLLKYGMRIPAQLRLIGRALKIVRNAHLDH